MGNQKEESIDVKALAALARIKVTDQELPELQRTLGDILAFVDQIKEAGGEPLPRTDEHRNVMRADGESLEPGEYSEALLSAAPKRTGNHIEVKQVLSKKKA
jgi:aspartyl/glutamyl-tRNA(Asn/Gln) amidotransferase C subunit